MKRPKTFKRDYSMPLGRAGLDIKQGNYVFNSDWGLVPGLPTIKYTPKGQVYQAVKTIYGFIEEGDFFEQDAQKYIAKDYLGQLVTRRVSTPNEVNLLIQIGDLIPYKLENKD